MKRKGLIIFLAAAGLLIVGEAVLQSIVSMEENKRAAAPGNSEIFDVGNLEIHPESVLTGKRILFLGSSVTYGAAAEGQSFVELFESLDGVRAIKEAKSGTTLVDRISVPALLAFGNGDSYIKRLRAVKSDDPLDGVVCQLSTNDATMKMPLGEISSSTALTDFDTQTITGAMEYIIKYSRERWNCPVVFYTGSYYDSPEYRAMVERLYALKDKWGIGLIDLYTDAEFNNIDPEIYELYMFDPIHPTKAGYINWWMPKMEKELIAMYE